jgi:hypothetical protein
MQLVLSMLLALAQPAGSDAAALERALASVRAESICADVRFIAADELEGRDTPSQGLRLAARYLAARLERLGLQPLGDVGYFDHYTLTSVGLDPERSALDLERDGAKTVLVHGRDAFVSATELDVAGPLLCVGAGRPEDYDGLELAGSWALVVPSAEVPWWELGRAARAAGALGLVVLPDPDDEERGGRQSSLSRRMRVEGMEERDRGPAFAQVRLTRSGARALFGDARPARGTKLAGVLRDRRALGQAQEEILENVCGFWPGRDAALAKEVLVLSAHYDHVGKQNGEIHNGADDNGSGTSALLAVAEALTHYGPLRRSVLLLWVSGEEKGLWGSGAWTKKPTLAPGFRAVANVNLDMIGRNAPDLLLITPTKALEHYNGLTRLAEALAPLEGFPVLGSCDDFWERSDHKSFAVNLEIPVAFLFSQIHEDYHQPGDDAEKIDCDKIRRVTRLIVRMLDGLQSDTLGL